MIKNKIMALAKIGQSPLQFGKEKLTSKEMDQLDFHWKPKTLIVGSVALQLKRVERHFQITEF